MSNFDEWMAARTELTTPTSTDLIPIIDDVAGTPSTKKVTAANLATYFAGSSGGDSDPDPVALVLYSQDVPAAAGAAHYVDNAATWSTLPFDGLAVYSHTGDGGVFNRTDTLSSGDVSTEWDGFHDADWGPMTSHWPLIRITDTDAIDLTNNTHWSTICANAATFVAGTKGSKVAGYLFDNEDYSPNSLFDYTSGGLSTMQAWARQRGEEFMTAIIGAWPEAQVTCAHGPYLSDPKTGVDVWSDQQDDPPYWNPVSTSNELTAWFIFGMATATIGTDAKVYDGGEVYAARSFDHHLRVRSWQLNGMPNTDGTIVPDDLRGVNYPIGATLGVYDQDEFNSYDEHDFDTIETMLASAMRAVTTSHGRPPMVWFYMEHRDPYPGGLPGNTDESWKPWLTTPYTDMVEAARIAGRSGPIAEAVFARTVRTPEQDGAVGNGMVLTDAAITSGDATLTSASATFTGRSGQSVWVAGAGAAGALLSTTILSVTNATTVELNTNAGTTVTNAQALVGTNDTSALNTWLARGASNVELKVTEGAVYVHSGVLSVTTKTDVLLTGRGAKFVAPVQATSGFKFFSIDGLEIQGLEVTMHPEPTTRGTTEDHYGLYFQACSDMELHDLHAAHSHAAGILLLGCSDVRGYNSASVRTRADGLHFTGGSTRVRWFNHRSMGVEDDGVAVVSYVAANPDTLCRDIKVYGARSWYPKTAGRGITVVGGDDCWFYDFEVHGTLQAGVYFAAEGSFDTHRVTNSGAIGGRVVNCVQSASFDHPAIFVYNGQTGLTNDNLTFLDIEVVDSGSQPTSFAAVGVGNDAGSGGDNERITMGSTGQPIVITGTYWPPATKYDSGQTPAVSNLVMQARTLPQLYLGFLEQDPASISAGSTITASVTVTGVTAAGSVVLGVTHSGTNATTEGLQMWGQVSAADTVRVYARNNSGGAIDIGTGYWHVVATDI